MYMRGNWAWQSRLPGDEREGKKSNLKGGKKDMQMEINTMNNVIPDLDEKKNYALWRIGLAV